ncbi:MAG: hypothetical protein AAGD38_18955 [Acidobacteriota bacterium]
MTLSRPLFMLAITFVGVTGLASPIAAQPATVLSLDFFEFSNPGARSLGFGGAFAALADDATAAYANPAGLGQLVEQEVSFEVRSWNRSVPFLAGGRVDGAPTGIGIDTEPGPIEGQADQNTVDLSFVSYVRPYERWALALFHHQLARFEIQTEAQGQFFDVIPGVPIRFPATRERLEFDLTSTGASASWKVNETLSLGLGVAYISGSALSRTEIYFAFAGDPVAQFEPVTFSPDERSGSLDFKADGSTLAARAGVLWRPTEAWSAAAFFRQGGSIDGELFRQNSGAGGDFSNTEATEFNIPDVYGVGVAYRALDNRLTLAAEIDRFESEALFINEDTVGESGAWEEYHLGGEYADVVGSRLVAWRGGVWYDSRRQGFTDDDGTIHYAVGVGLATGRWQFDLGADFSDAVDTIGLSTIYKF